ncbi:hypothetical protein KP509_20G015100 [Ceratopteris richardii]|uniref:Pentatricopeptide repeat-containing protein n=1 Tax=Ceratopteris richardii TaxID=49495 RepID=A0A8T2SGM1_CERRI|nr:hypothetical protein KP509_20G015100 [Ceratopteris richardii]
MCAMRKTISDRVFRRFVIQSHTAQCSLSPYLTLFGIHPTKYTLKMSVGQNNHLHTHKMASYVQQMDANMGKLVDEQSFQRSCFLDSGTTNQINLTECKNALFMYESMHKNVPVLEGHNYVDILKACALLIDVKIGCQVHADLARMGLLETNFYVKNSLISMYVKWGCLSRAIEVHQALSVRDVVTWTALINGHAQLGSGGEALNCFRRMQLECICPNGATFACILKACVVLILSACGNLYAADAGKVIHDEILSKDFLRVEPMIGSALVNMYVKCGMYMKAKAVFNELSFCDSVAWNSLITGYAQLGDVKSVFHTINHMITEGNSPDAITLINVLNACSHAGMITEGGMYFIAISTECSVIPSIDHYICILDLISRAGQLEKSIGIMRHMPFHPNNVMTAIVLGGCRKWGNVELATEVFEEALQVDEVETAACLCMYNIITEVDSL